MMAENGSERGEKAFRKLIVWQKAHALVLSIYQLVEGFPKSEMFGLSSQLRRAAVSVPANIVEGYGSGKQGQFGRYLNISQGSLAEVEYYLILAQDLKYISSEQYERAEALRSEVGYLLFRLIAKVKS
jgi:four helix bundle protein